MLERERESLAYLSRYAHERGMIQKAWVNKAIGTRLGMRSVVERCGSPTKLSCSYLILQTGETNKVVLLL